MVFEKKYFFFLVCFFFTLIQPVVLSKPILTFAPYLVFSLIHFPLKKALWQSIFCGLIIDLFQTSLPFGFSCFAYSFSCLILYKQKSLFYNDKIFSLPLFTSCFSIVFSLIHQLFFYIQKKPLDFSWFSICSDYLLMPCFDGFYTLIFFTTPLFLRSYILKKRQLN